MLIPKTTVHFYTDKYNKPQVQISYRLCFLKVKTLPMIFRSELDFCYRRFKIDPTPSEINLNKLSKKQKSYTKKGPLKNLREHISATDAPIVTILSPKKRSGKDFRFSKLAFFWPNENFTPFSLEISRLKRCTSCFSLQE